jgi:threonine synthase
MNNLYYKSTRSNKEKILSSQAIVNGIAGEGGLYIPSLFPKIDKSFGQLKEMDYRQLAFYIMKKYLTDFDGKELKSCIDSAYDAKFDSPLIAPLTKVGEVFFLELYHGITLAFKDMALSILPHILKVSAT